MEDGLSIVLTTAYLDEAERCHRLAFMDRGRITATGTPGEITAMIPGGVRSFPSPEPFADSEKIAATGCVSTVFGTEVHVMGETGDDALKTALGREVELRRKEPSVEDAFVYLSAVSGG